MANGLKQVIKANRRSSIVGFMLDNTSQGRQTWAESEGIRMRLPDVGFRLARRDGTGVVPAFARLEDGCVHIKVYPPGDQAAAVHALLEEVRLHPDEWVWWGKAGAVAQ